MIVIILLLLRELVELRVDGVFLELDSRRDGGYFLLEDNPVPTFEPCQHISVVKFFRQQLIERFRLIFLSPP